MNFMKKKLHEGDRFVSFEAWRMNLNENVTSMKICTSLMQSIRVLKLFLVFLVSDVEKKQKKPLRIT